MKYSRRFLVLLFVLLAILILGIAMVTIAVVVGQREHQAREATAKSISLTNEFVATPLDATIPAKTWTPIPKG